MRSLLTRFFRALLKLFFRRIEIAGEEKVPLDRPVIFAANHPNGLLDPLFILCFVPRRVSFLAKAPLFRYPVIGALVRMFESIPVYRKQDNTKGSTAETFGRAREVLRGGGSIAIFPEGTTHSDSQLRELKTGAARIALGAELPALTIIPAGIYYTAKQTFRSEALVWFGEGIEVKPVAIGEDGEPAADDVLSLTSKIEKQLDSVTLQADSHAALELIERAERIFSAGESQPLASELELRRRFVQGYHYLREHDPDRLERLASLLRRFESELGGARLDPEDLTPRIRAGAMLRIILLLPLAFVGAIVHFIPYRIVDFLSRRFSKDADEMTATIKFISALAFYPLTWIAVAAGSGGLPGVLIAILVAVSGYVALRVIEDVDDVIGNLRAFRHRDLVAQRQLIRDQIASVAGALNL
ncbi:MAG TPA: lysophospholipid acyltransferase family protein [Thermoanaerobaculia bacterium]|nr:lysophospholipid acyltransferase family protein [Thermoanaerobaculia bacterium]